MNHEPWDKPLKQLKRLRTQIAPISHHVCRDVGKSLHHSTPQLSDIPQLHRIVHRPRRQQMAVLVERDRRELAPLFFFT